jgi:serine/threonine-protein kinase
MGIVHRDLKPDNLFLTRRPDGAPLVKVLDFGISKASSLNDAAGGMTRTSIMMGSPYFMSPEQMRSAKDVDARSDVWSLGVCLFQLLTARLPFEADSLGGLMARVLQDDPATLVSLRPEVPPDVAALVRRCLVRDLDQRTQDVGEIAAILAPYAHPRARPIADRVVSLVSRRGLETTVRASLVSWPEAAAITGSGLPVVGAAPITGSGRVLGAAPPPELITGAPVTATRIGGCKTRTGLVLGAVAAGIALGVVAFFLSRGPRRPAVEAAALPPATSVEAPVPEEVAAPVVAPATAPAPATTTTAAPTASAVVSAVPAVPAVTAAPSVPRAPVARPAVPAPRPTATPAATPKKSVLDDRN